MRRLWLAAAMVVIVTNVVAMVPVWRERTGDARRVTVTACAPQLVGGYGEADRLRLSIHADTYGAVAGLDRAGLAALGFPAEDIARLGDTMALQELPAARRAWVRIEQRTDPDRAWRAVEVGPTRQSVVGDGLVVRGRIGFGYEARGTGRMPVVPQLLGVEPTNLYLTADQADALRALRRGEPECRGGSTVVVANGSRGGVWVVSVP